MNNHKPIIISMGDPAGIGPEILAKSLTVNSLKKDNPLWIVGDKQILQRAEQFCSVKTEITSVKRSEDLPRETGSITLLDLQNASPEEVPVGRVSAAGGQAAFEYIQKGIELAQSVPGASLVTGPINKESLKAAEVPYIGHTEILGDLTKTENPVTMFETLGLRIFFLSRHVSLKQACDLVTKDNLLKFIRRCQDLLLQLGFSQPRIAVAGLNPHSGEHGLFGTEEVDHVEPAVKLLQKEGLDVKGPIGADSVFHQAKTGLYDGVISLYHDQGHIASKTLDFERTISVTLGLPFLRTSVDHGTAFDIAGTGKASPVSLIEAVEVAKKYS